MGNCSSISEIKVETEKRKKVNRKRKRIVGGFCCFGKKGEVRKIYNEIKSSDEQNII